MNGLQLIATGGALPGRTVTNEDLSRVVDTSDEWITTRTGIRTRHWCTEGESAATLANAAAWPRSRSPVVSVLPSRPRTRPRAWPVRYSVRWACPKTARHWT